MKLKLIWIMTPALILLFAGCRQTATPSLEEATTASPAATLETTPAPVATTTSTLTEESPNASGPVEAVPTRLGANYVLQLPRENSVPDNWAMDRQPDFRVPDRQPGENYRFACLDLPARSTGTASVGYRSLEGMPSVFIEYVIYESAESARAALEDMRRAAESCPEFQIGAGDSATAASLAMIEFQPVGEASFGASLETSNTASGELTTHLLKVLQDNIIIGINHATFTADGPPASELTETLAEVAVRNLSGLANDY